MVRHVLLVMAILGVTGCGAAQAIHDGTVNATSRALGTAVTTMNLDILNQTGDTSSPAIVRVYQLTSSEGFEAITDAQWIASDLRNLKDDLLAADNIVLPPGASESLQTPMREQAQMVGIVAWLPEGEAKPIKLMIPRKSWAKRDPVAVVVERTELRLRAPVANR